MNARHYLHLVFAFLLLLLSAIGIFNYFINPYLIFPDNRIKGFNAVKSDINNFAMQAKAYQPLQMEIDTLLVGNSRIDIGLNPQHSCLSDHTYNLGIPGAGIEMQVAYALNLIRQNPIKQVIMGLDFVDFLQARTKTPTDNFTFNGQARLRYLINGKQNPDYHWYRFKDYYLSTLSLETFVSSIKTIFNQNDNASDLSTHGFNPANDFAAATKIEGAFQLFQQKLNRLRNKYSKEWVYISKNTWASTDYKSLSRLIKNAESFGIELIFFINPLHKSFFDLLQQNHLHDDYLRWQSDIAQFLKIYPREPIPIHDFAQMPGFTDEPLPKPDQKGGLEWFWEPSHYKSQLGDYLLDRLCSKK